MLFLNEGTALKRWSFAQARFRKFTASRGGEVGSRLADKIAGLLWYAALVRLKWSQCNEAAINDATSEPPPPMSSVDTATLELLAVWKAEDATTDPDKIRESDKEVAEFKKAMNENRAATGARLLFP